MTEPAKMPLQIQPTNWQHLCEAAARETAPAKLIVVLGEIECAIFHRLQELWKTEPAERSAIVKAVESIRRLQIERLKFPQWETDPA